MVLCFCLLIKAPCAGCVPSLGQKHSKCQPTHDGQHASHVGRWLQQEGDRFSCDVQGQGLMGGHTLTAQGLSGDTEKVPRTVCQGKRLCHARLQGLWCLCPLATLALTGQCVAWTSMGHLPLLFQQRHPSPSLEVGGTSIPHRSPPCAYLHKLASKAGEVATSSSIFRRLKMRHRNNPLASSSCTGLRL